ncbi:phage portal protein [Chromobacterium violaceum]|uniref:Phage head morphogenesis domain-containing protein n=1 Tax=Chromobacterium violaceum TaxID=536 RepID=A0A202B5K1_CHRVL|nr:phage portal protein [Chromobacterium violaceum]OVE46698.1 hypothetical protein CBW21_17530 [Chromobacterium violaceum]
MAQATVTPIEPGLIARVVAGARYVFTGKSPDWFGPGEPQQPAAPSDVTGRQMDYATGINLQGRPRHEEAVSFAQMRALADSYDLMRLIIETRKDQLAKLKWTVKRKDKVGTPANESAEPDARCGQLVEFFQSPDKEHDWNTWLRMLLEDLLVIDAPAVYPRRTLGGALYALEPIDGSTIKRVLDQGGRTPAPPDPAYQQILKGLPAVDYTREELIYMPRNPRTHKVYGYSPVEQVITTVNIALRRQAHQMSYYTDGATPDLIFQVPESWQADQIRQFEDWWNSVLAGNDSERRKTRFVPKGVEPFNTKAAALKDEMDEWLARIICYAFSVSPQPFIKEMNRATAQTGAEQALAEGLAPMQEWVKALMDRIILRHFGWSDIEFVWHEEESVKPLEQSEIDKNYVEAKILHPDEVRAKRFGLQPLTPEQKADLSPAPPPLPGEHEEASTSTPNKTDKEALGKVKKARRLIDRERDAVVRARAAISTIIERCHKRLAGALAQAAMGAEVAKDDGKRDFDHASFEEIISQAYNELLAKRVRKQLKRMARDGVAEGFGQLGIDPDSVPDALAQANTHAISYADARAAELVGMKWVDGEWVINPNPRWAISDTTRRRVADLVQQATDDGWSADTLAIALREDPAFGPARAEMIARTECAFADAEGNLAAYQESGLVDELEWLTGAGCCAICAAMNGERVPLGKNFSHGRGAAPAHPRCRCDVLPVLITDSTKLAKSYTPGQPLAPRTTETRLEAGFLFMEPNT